MVLFNRLLLDPAPASGGGVTPPAPAATPSPAPAPSPAASPTNLPSAASALGLDEPPSRTLGAVYDQNRKNLPPVTATFPKPAEPAPAPPKPAEPPAPAPEPPKPATPPPPTPAPERKVKIGDKEYTEAELADLVNKQQQQQQQAQTPQPQPPAPTPTPQDAPKPPTAEEIAKAESDWVARHAAGFNFDVSNEHLEQVLAGGEEGVTALKSIFANLAAKAVLESRKSIFTDLERDLTGVQNLAQAVQSLMTERQQLQQYTIEQKFVAEYPEFKDHLDIARQIGQTILENYPDQVRQMAQDDFIKVVAQETDKYLIGLTKRIQPQFAAKTWKEYYQSQQTPPTPPVAPPVVPPVAEPTPPPPPAAPPVRPPVSNPPVAPVYAGFSKDQHKTIAQDLRNA